MTPKIAAQNAKADIAENHFAGWRGLNILSKPPVLMDLIFSFHNTDFKFQIRPVFSNIRYHVTSRSSPL